MNTKLVSALGLCAALSVALAVPPAIPANAQQGGLQPTCVTTEASCVVVLEPGQDFKDAVNKAEAWLKAGHLGATATVALAPGRHEINFGGIKASGRIVIEGPSVETAAEATATVVTGSNTIEIHTPVEFHNVRFEHKKSFLGASSVFGASGELIIKKAYLDFAYPKESRYLIEIDNAPKIVLEDSYIAGMKILKHSTSLNKENEIIVRGNEFRLDKVRAELTSPVIQLRHFKQFQNADSPIRSIIERNRFIAQSPISQSDLGVSDYTKYVLTIRRSNVSVTNNLFDFPTLPVEGSLITVQGNQESGLQAGQPVDHVDISYNEFKGGTALGSPVSYLSSQALNLDKPNLAPEEKAVQFHHNDISSVKGLLPPHKGNDQHHATGFNLNDNFWGDLAEEDTFKKITSAARPERFLKPGDRYGIQPKDQPQQPQEPPAPQPPVRVPGPQPETTPQGETTPERTVTRFAGESRVETAIKIAQAAYPRGAKTVILARSDVFADSVSAVSLAKTLDSPILLTPSDALHPGTEAEIKRLLPQGGEVIVMGGKVALNDAVEARVKALGATVNRIAGENRAGTAVETATMLKAKGKLNTVVLVDGGDWQPSLIAGPASAKASGAILLTNGKSMAPETAEFLKQHSAVSVTAIGSAAKEAGSVKQAIEAANPTALSLAVAQSFFDKPSGIGLATTEDFADALAGGAHAGKVDAPLLLVGKTLDEATLKYVDAAKTVTKVVVYGGTTRISEDALAPLIKKPAAEKPAK